jgi:hypothetical protein
VVCFKDPDGAILELSFSNMTDHFCPIVQALDRPHPRKRCGESTNETATRQRHGLAGLSASDAKPELPS